MAQETLVFFFLQARLQRGHLLLKQGKLDEAEDDFKKVVSWCLLDSGKMLFWENILGSFFYIKIFSSDSVAKRENDVTYFCGDHSS